MNTFTIQVNQQGEQQLELNCVAGDNLLRILQQNGCEIYAPCGGNGTCGKCRVRIHNEGLVTSCNYIISHSIEVHLPKQQQQKVLTSQHDYCFESDTVAPSNKNYVPEYGIAIDIGTTTLAFYFIELHNNSLLTSTSATNPQTRYGADVISRIQFCNSDMNKIKELQKCIIDEINKQVQQVCNQHGCNPNDITKISIAGNPTMLHLLLGYDPMPIALAPFTPAFLDEQIKTAENLNIAINPNGVVKTLPNISAYVGADIVAGISSIKPSSKFKTYLFLDIGTNGEMALITPDKIYCCATAAGPAFEGGNISSGMGAFPGAISEYTAPNKYITIENAEPIGICGSGLIDIIAYMVNEKIIAEDGLLEKDFKVNYTIAITQQDIREVQLAKSAIMAGLNILVSAAGLTIDEIDALFLAGGFGNYIRIESALKIGLVPKELNDKIIPIGNTSGTGAFLSMQSEAYNENLQNILEKTEYIELSTHEDFVMEYAMNMNFES